MDIEFVLVDILNLPQVSRFGNVLQYIPNVRGATTQRSPGTAERILTTISSPEYNDAQSLNGCMGKLALIEYSVLSFLPFTAV